MGKFFLCRLLYLLLSHTDLTTAYSTVKYKFRIIIVSFQSYFAKTHIFCKYFNLELCLVLTLPSSITYNSVFREIMDCKDSMAVN